jgi:undecaprenol kinase
MINLRKLGKSFGYALIGWRKVFEAEQNFRIHTLVGLMVLVLALVLKVAILEIINTVFERLLDLIKPRLHVYVQDIKDMTAAVVLIGSLAAVVIGCLIFYPYIVNLFI